MTVGFDAALCCLNLAHLYLENGRPKDANRLSGELFPVFHLLRLNREATSALLIFRRAAEQDRLTVELVRDVKARIEAIPTPPSIPRGT
ncbi:MAG: hypothetical protein GY856_12810 [bacterium]|nr:hypothetical protein [bacterium]